MHFLELCFSRLLYFHLNYYVFEALGVLSPHFIQHCTVSLDCGLNRYWVSFRNEPPSLVFYGEMYLHEEMGFCNTSHFKVKDLVYIY